MEEHCLKGECTVCHQELTDSVTINKLNRLIVCPCTRCNNYHSIVPIYDLLPSEENESQDYHYLQIASYRTFSWYRMRGSTDGCIDTFHKVILKPRPTIQQSVHEEGSEDDDDSDQPDRKKQRQEPETSSKTKRMVTRSQTSARGV